MGGFRSVWGGGVVVHTHLDLPFFIPPLVIFRPPPLPPIASVNI